MNSKSTFLPSVLLIIFFISCVDSNSEKGEKLTYTLHGTINNFEEDTIILYRPDEDPLYQNIKIPVIDGKFSYDFKIDEPIGYDLMYWKNGNPGGRWLTVFLEENDIELTLFPEDEWDKNVVEGGNINDENRNFSKLRNEKFGNELSEISDQLNGLFEAGNYFTPSMQNLRNLKKDAEGKELENINKAIKESIETESHLTDSAKTLISKLKDVNEKSMKWKGEYIDTHDNIIAYHAYLTKLSYRPERIDLDRDNENYKKFIKKFPNHPYNSIAQEKLRSFSNIKVGQKFTDFILPDLEGNEISLSELVEGKKAVIVDYLV